jgi:hypothetical protein
LAFPLQIPREDFHYIIPRHLWSAAPSFPDRPFVKLQEPEDRIGSETIYHASSQ